LEEKKMRKFTNKKKGFTLIELLVVVAILGILMLLAVPRFMDSTKGSKVRTFESNFRTLMSMANQYSANNNGVFKDIEKSDVKELADQLKGKPDASLYVVGTENIVGTLNLKDANVGEGTYSLTYTYGDGKVTVSGEKGLEDVKLKSSFKKVD